MNKAKRQGFSLVELMVVVSIIGVLMAVGAVSYITAQRKGRNAARRSDIKGLQQAMEQYFTVNGAYPVSSDCAALFSGDQFVPGGLPSDPKPTQSYDLSCDSINGNGYCICAQLEDETGNSSALPSGSSFSCNFSNTGTLPYFCVTNQQ